MEVLNPFALDLKNTILIEASAGTGKTYTITTIYTRLVLQGYKVDSILVVTFTEAAAAELKLRIRKRLSLSSYYLETSDGDLNSDIDHELIKYLKSGTEKDLQQKKIYLKNAIKMFDQALIMTIHSFCLKILKENSFETRTFFNIELSTDQSKLEQEICFDFFAERINTLDPLFLKYLKIKKIVPEKLMGKFSNLLGRPDIQLVPEKMDFVDAFDEYRQVLKKIKNCIKDHGSEIKDFIAEHPGINKRSYKKNSVKKWLEQIKEKLSCSQSDIIFDMQEKGDSLYKFTLTRLGEKMKSGYDVPDYDFFIYCQEIFDLTNIFKRNILSIEIEYFKYLKEKFLKNKEISGKVFFNDLINDLALILNKDSDSRDLLVSTIREKCHAVLIDEFQDTDQTQYFIFSTLFANRKNFFCMIGDPKQAIYGFRGGDIFAYLKAVKDSKKIYTLDKNYRSDPELVRSINTLFSKQSNPFLFEEIGFFPVTTPETSCNRLVQDNGQGSCLKFIYIKGEEINADLDKKGFIKKSWAHGNIPEIIAENINRLLNSNTLLDKKKIKPSDIAVLVRTNIQADKINNALNVHNIPAHIYSTGSVLDSRQAMGMTDILNAVLTPGNHSFIKAALVTEVFEFTGNEINELNSDKEAFSLWQARFRHYHDLWVNHGFIRMIQEIFYSNEAFSKEKTFISDRCLTNYNHLIELLHYTQANEHFSPGLLLKWFRKEQAKAAVNTSLEEIRLETDKSAVSIVTIHKSKGLEWPVVYLPYLWDGKDDSGKRDYCLFHDPHDNFKEKFDIGSDQISSAKIIADNEAKAEEMRLLYVALTRASSMVNIVWGKFNLLDLSALAMILHNNSITDDMKMIEDIQGMELDISHDSKEIMCPLQYNESKNKAGDINDNKCIRTLSRDISKTWRISSFSSLISKDEYNFHIEQGIKDKGHDQNIIILKNFPKGAGSGEFFHSLFEELDFQDTNENIIELIRSKLLCFGYSADTWEKIILEFVNHALSTPLMEQDNCFILKNIGKEKRLNELEFFFPVKMIDTLKLYKIFKEDSKQNLISQYADKVLKLGFNSFQGFMKGFIDLIFEFNNKWYIVDYKSNFLGDSYNDYSIDAMNTAMADHHYFLQYHIYVIALHKYLQFRLKDYDYNEHFGGVFYLFIRGMHPEQSPLQGVFFDQPDCDFIHKLSELF